MTIIAIPSSFSFLSKHILYDPEFGDFSLSSSVPKNAWIIGKCSSNYNNVSELSKLNGKCFSFSPPKKYENILNEILKKDKNVHKINWKNFMSEEDHKKWLSGLLQSAVSVLNDKNDAYYQKIFRPSKSVLERLERSIINPPLLARFINEDQSNQRSVLKLFLSDKEGFAPIPVYDQISSITGRLVVKSGADILRLKKEYRKILESKWGNKGKIFCLDFKSLEPRFALSLVREVNNKDVYEYIHRQIFKNLDLPRTAVKLFVIAVLYGMKANSVKNRFKKAGLNENIDFEEIIGKVKEIFEINQLAEKLVLEAKKVGYIKNYFGRLIKTNEEIMNHPYSLVNYFIQSSCVDIAMLGFKSVVDLIDEGKMMIRPIFVQHDSIYLDVHENFEYALYDLKKTGSEIEEYDKTKFWMEAEEI